MNQNMIFYKGEGENPFDSLQERYSTFEQAQGGHAKAVAMVRKHLDERLYT